MYKGMKQFDKKSVKEAQAEAVKLSLANPDVEYYVMDKKNKRAAVHASEWVVREKILDGWNILCRYKGGKMI